MIAGIVLGVLLAQAPQPQRDTRPTPAAGTATIGGTVVSDEAQPKPLRRARVTLNGPTLAPGRTAITADDGTFAFERLPPGRYTVAATKDAYVTMNYGARRPGRAGTPIVLRDGEARKVTLALPRGAVITGVMTDADGLPAQGVQVTALTRRYVGALGNPRILPAGTTASPTDDRGVYRIFGLPAGEYMVTAQSQQRAVGLPVPEVRTMNQGTISPRAVSLAPVFYPGATDVARASMVTVGAGEERSGIDLPLQYAPMAIVTGMVAVTPGSTPPSITMARLGEIVGAEGTRNARADADGRFSFPSVAPGQYVLFARSVPASPVTTSGSPPTVPPGPHSGPPRKSSSTARTSTWRSRCSRQLPSRAGSRSKARDRRPMSRARGSR